MESNTVAPFVLKTYQMVDGPSTNLLIKWGRENNTFIVTDPCSFSQNLLPVYFKHNNFSSFIRQLNTYGFKKVDPDIWEFANEAFLRGQIQLLKNIVRRRYSRYTYNAMQPKREYESQFDEKELSIEVKRLRYEDKVLGDEIQMMGKRLEAAERRPQEMMAFLQRIVQEPETLSRIMTDKEQEIVLRKKKRRIPSTQNVPQALALPAVPFTDSSADQSFRMVFFEDCGASTTQATSSSFPFSLLG